MGDRATGPALTTIVFVDVEASTALLDRVGDVIGMASVSRQLGQVRERVEAYGGNLVKSTGDGFLLTFSSPRQALSFALASQRVLAGSLPRVRVGINTGEVVTDGVDPLGAAVNAAARIAGRAGGGEVLVSDVVRQLVGTVPAVRFLDRGRCRLKGFSERWHLWTAEDSTNEQHTTATIGRIAELARVADLVSSTAAGVGRVLLLEGEAGIGKTQLVREATAQARRAGLDVVEVAADEVVRRPGVIPHALVDAAGHGLPSRERLAGLLTTKRTSIDGGEDLSFAVVESSVDLLEELARDTPVLVAAEDLHWADDLSLNVLVALARRTTVSRFAVIGSMRMSPRPISLDRLLERVREGLGSHVRVGSLDEVDVVAMASAITGAAPGEGLRERLRATAGNPLYVTELLRSFDDDGLLRIESGVVDVTPGVISADLHDVLVRRLSWLPTETTELLRLASLLGSAFTLHDLAAITGRAVIDIAACLREASLAGLIVGDADRLAFRHELIREAVYGHMLPAERRDLHRSAGQALAHAGAPTQQIAQQFALGALPGDIEAVGWLERAAVDTIPVSPSAALVLLEQAVAVAPAQWPGRTALQARMIEPLAWCGRFDDAESIAHTVLAAAPDAHVEFTALYGLSAAYGNRGDTASSVATLYRAVAVPGAPDDAVRRLRCLAAQLSLVTGAMSVEEARRIAEDTLAESETEASPTTQCLAHQVLGAVATVTGYGVIGREHLTAALALLDSGRVTAATYLIPDIFHALGLLELDAIAEAIETAENGRQRAERCGALALLPLAYMAAARARVCAGRWDDAFAEIEAGLEVVEDTGSFLAVLSYEAILAEIAIHRGDLATAEAHLAAGTKRFAEGVAVYGLDLLLGAQAEFLAASGQPEAALNIANTTWTQTASARYLYGHRARGILLVRLALAEGHAELADSVTAELEEGARRSPAASAAGAALLCRGLVEQNPDLALGAVAKYRETPMRPDHAACCENAAALLAASGHRNDAVGLLHEAATIYSDIDARAGATRVDAALRELGARARRARANRPRFGWDSLTPMEADVSRLVAEGLTNPEIGARLYISRRTVETHLSHVFRKVGLTSRTHLAAELTRRGTAS